jgi:Cdc6-like AAA superfamily ATPase
VKLRGRGDAEPFAFSRVLPATASQSQVFQATAEKLLLDFYAFSYCHSTMFMYGPTGSGKTHTALGTPSAPGLFPQSLRHIFATLHKALEAKTLRVMVSALEARRTPRPRRAPAQRSFSLFPSPLPPLLLI